MYTCTYIIMYIVFRKDTQGMDALHGIPRVKAKVFHNGSMK